jgi:hypothetical protein
MRAGIEEVAGSWGRLTAEQRESILKIAREAE